MRIVRYGADGYALTELGDLVEAGDLPPYDGPDYALSAAQADAAAAQAKRGWDGRCQYRTGLYQKEPTLEISYNGGLEWVEGPLAVAKPVSYTHLDVYKRQVYAPTVKGRTAPDRHLCGRGLFCVWMGKSWRGEITALFSSARGSCRRLGRGRCSREKGENGPMACQLTLQGGQVVSNEGREMTSQGMAAVANRSGQKGLRFRGDKDVYKRQP